VPTTSGSTPKLAGWNSGAQVLPLRNVQNETSLKNSNAGMKSEMTIPTVVRIEISAQRARTTLTTSSPQRLRVARSLTAPAETSCVASLRLPGFLFSPGS
jgi:hypothetical protein